MQTDVKNVYTALIKRAEHLTKCERIWSNAARFANWSDALRI